jgi:hypothetical protein
VHEVDARPHARARTHTHTHTHTYTPHIRTRASHPHSPAPGRAFVLIEYQARLRRRRTALGRHRAPAGAQQHCKSRCCHVVHAPPPTHTPPSHTPPSPPPRKQLCARSCSNKHTSVGVGGVFITATHCSTCPPISPPPPHVNSFVLGPAVINTHPRKCVYYTHGSVFVTVGGCTYYKAVRVGVCVCVYYG